MMGLDMGILRNGNMAISMRKDNAIRNWFSKHCYDFQDNGTTEISRSLLGDIIDDMWDVITAGKLEGLVDIYETVYFAYDENTTTRDAWDNYLEGAEAFVPNGENDKGSEDYLNFCKVAQELLPTQSGFFFGDVSYDNWYVDEIISNYVRFKELYDEVSEDDVLEYWEWY
jgi:hypothetical protein